LSTKKRKRKAAPPKPKERKHAKLSPSTLKSKAICPGFINDPDGDPTARDRGTLGHKAVETNNPALCGDDEQLRRAVEKCLEYRQKILDARPEVHYLSFTEIRFEYFQQWGFCDEVLFCQGTVADLFDWKFAYNFYEADSPQFWAYCLGAWNKWPHLETIRVHVVHPFLDEVDIETFTRAKNFADFQVKIKGVMASANLNRPEDYRVTAQCAYCGFAGKCVKLAAVGVEIGRRYAPDLVVPDINFHGSQITEPSVFAALLRLRKPVEKAAGGWAKAATELYNNGTDIPGFKLVTKKGERKVASILDAFKIVKTHFAPDMKAEEFIKHCKVTVTGLDEIVRDTAPTGSKDKAQRELAARLEDADALTFGSGTSYLIPVKEERDDE
jgi:hypothetical protein